MSQTPSKIPAMTADKRAQTFLRELAIYGNVSDSAQIAGIERKLVYEWRAKYVQFAEMWHAALECVADRLEQEAIRRGAEGYLEPKFYKGVECAKIRKFSDNLLMFTLKGLRPEKFADRQQVSGPGGGPIPMAAAPVEPKTLEEWQKQVENSKQIDNKPDESDGIIDI